MPYIVTSQTSLPVQEQFRKQGVRFGRDLILKSNHRPYVNIKIFLDSIKTVLLSYFVLLQSLAGFAAEDVVLLMDNCSAHVTRDVIRLPTAAFSGSELIAISIPSSVQVFGWRSFHYCKSLVLTAILVP
jgi:hypothetical protein